MASPDRYTQVLNEYRAKLLAQGVPADRVDALASQAAGAQILREIRGPSADELPPPLVAPPSSRKLRMAKGDALGLIVMGALSIVAGMVMHDAMNAAVGLLLGVAGLVENAGYRRYMAQQPRARGLLVGSQLGVLALVWTYCAISLLGPGTAANPEAQDLMKQLGGDASEFGGLIDNVTHMVYLTFAGVSLLYQGGLAFYYYKKTEA